MLNKALRRTQNAASAESFKFILSMLVLSMAVVSFGQNYSLFGKLDKKWPIFKPGEQMVFTITLFDDKTPVSGKKMKWIR